MVEETEPLWIQWSHEHGFITRYEAHGSPGNLLDLYAVADIPETEFFARTGIRWFPNSLPPPRT